MTEIDTSKPNAARIYDYLLGGNNNFEADRAAAEQLLSLIPSIRNGARLNRWFMYDAIQRLSEQHFKCYLDLATGLPTQDYIHDVLPDVKIVYNDLDPVTVTYGRQVVGDDPRILYLQSDLLKTEDILQQVEQHFGGERQVGIFFIGVSYFFDDTQLRDVLQTLYDWCAPGSQLAISWLMLPDQPDPALTQFLEMYKKIGVNLYGRKPAQIETLIQPWRLTDAGLRPLDEWNAMDKSWIDAKDLERDQNLFGCIVTKA
jgi:hypothetical protein